MIELDRMLPATAGVPDWDDVLHRVGVQQRRRRRRIATLAVVALVFAVGTASAFGTVRDLIPRLKAARAQGIVEYPLNKIVL